VEPGGYPGALSRTAVACVCFSLVKIAFVSAASKSRNSRFLGDDGFGVVRSRPLFTAANVAVFPAVDVGGRTQLKRLLDRGLVGHGVKK